MDSLLTGFRPGFFWLLRRVYHHLLRGRTRRNVGPVPASSLDQKALDCADSSSANFATFLGKLTPVKGPKDASTQQEVDVAAAEALGLTQSQVSMRGLQNEYFLSTARKPRRNSCDYRALPGRDERSRGAASPGCPSVLY